MKCKTFEEVLKEALENKRTGHDPELESMLTNVLYNPEVVLKRAKKYERTLPT